MTAMRSERVSVPWGARLVARREARIALLFVLPALILFIVFRFGPALVGVVLSLFDFTIYGDIDWRGLGHFERLLGDPLFYRALGTTLLYTILAVPLSIVLSMVVALGVRRAFRGSRFFRSVFFLPVITSLVLASSVFIWIFSEGGPWSELMTPVGLGGSWLANAPSSFPRS